ncbi:hypothetical protein NUACC26_086910 [Scytonema sp. NUACC26]
MKSISFKINRPKSDIQHIIEQVRQMDNVEDVEGIMHQINITADEISRKCGSNEITILVQDLEQQIKDNK